MEELHKRLYKEFKEDLEIGWDFAISNLHNSLYTWDNKVMDADKPLVAYCKVYEEGYEATRENEFSPDDGVCGKIRQFAIEGILDFFEDELEENNN